MACGVDLSFPWYRDLQVPSNGRQEDETTIQLLFSKHFASPFTRADVAVNLDSIAHYDMSFPIALQPLVNGHNEKASLQDLVRRINEERGAFRNVTEEQLKEEIARDQPKLEDETLDVEEEDTPQDLEKRRKGVFAARNEMLQFIGYVAVAEGGYYVLRLSQTSAERSSHGP